MLSEYSLLTIILLKVYLFDSPRGENVMQGRFNMGYNAESEPPAGRYKNCLNLSFSLDVAQGRWNWPPNETRTPSFRFASLGC